LIKSVITTAHVSYNSTAGQEGLRR